MRCETIAELYSSITFIYEHVILSIRYYIHHSDALQKFKFDVDYKYRKALHIIANSSQFLFR